MTKDVHKSTEVMTLTLADNMLANQDRTRYINSNINKETLQELTKQEHWIKNTTLQKRNVTSMKRKKETEQSKNVR